MTFLSTIAGIACTVLGLWCAPGYGAFQPISIPAGGTGTTTAPAGQLIYGGSSYQSVATGTISGASVITTTAGRSAVGGALSITTTGGTFGAGTYIFPGNASSTGAVEAGGAGGVEIYAMGSGVGTLGFNSLGYAAGVAGYGALMQLAPSTGTFSMFLESNVAAGAQHAHLQTLGWDNTGVVTINQGFSSLGASSVTGTFTTTAQTLLATLSGMVGIGTTTPRWTLQVASTTGPQLALTGAANTAHWLFNNINGNLFFATSSPTTYATSSGLNNAVQFPANGGCIGCSDVLMNGGINLRNAIHILASTSPGVQDTYQTIYTAPAGRRALFYGSYAYNQTGGTIAYSVNLVSGSAHYSISGTSSITNGSSNVTTQPYILEPGESLQILQSATGALNGWLRFIEYDATTPFRSVKTTNLTGQATSTLYTVPANTSAVCTAARLFSFAIATVSQDENCTILTTGVTGTITYFLVKSGQVASDLVNKVRPSGAGNLFGTQLSGPVPMNAGDSLQYYFANAITNTNSMTWINVYER